ncbi:hypothetical protein BGX28_006017 [Mortierella sp. GBA30]|nr:hypothetical protein BGX28_006017 [Mortierella sp. GBA30]
MSNQNDRSGKKIVQKEDVSLSNAQPKKTVTTYRTNSIDNAGGNGTSHGKDGSDGSTKVTRYVVETEGASEQTPLLPQSSGGADGNTVRTIRSKSSQDCLDNGQPKKTVTTYRTSSTDNAGGNGSVYGKDGSDDSAAVTRYAVKTEATQPPQVSAVDSSVKNVHNKSSQDGIDHARGNDGGRNESSSGSSGNGARNTVQTEAASENTPLLSNSSVGADTQSSAGNGARSRLNNKSSNDHVGVDMRNTTDPSPRTYDAITPADGRDADGSLQGQKADLPSLRDRLRHWKKTSSRAIKIIGGIVIALLLAVAISPLLAQRVLDRALLMEIEKTEIRSPDQTGFQVTIQSSLRFNTDNDGFFGFTGLVQRVFQPTMSVEPAVLSLSLPGADEAVDMAQIEIEQQQMPLGGTFQLDISTHALVTNSTLMAEFFQSTLQQSSVGLAIRGPIVAKLGSLWYMNLRLDLAVTMDGLKGIQNATVASMALPGDNPQGGVTMSTVARLHNPSKVVSLQMGAVSFGVFLPSKTDPETEQYQIAEVKCPDLKLEAGQSSDIELSGRLFPIDDWTSGSTGAAFTNSSSEKQLLLGDLLSRFIRGEDSAIQVRALSKDTTMPPWLSQALSGTVLDMAFPGSPDKDFVKSLDMNQLQFGFSDNSESALLSGQLSSVLQMPPNVTFPIQLLKMKPTAWLRTVEGQKMSLLEVLDFLPTRSRQVGTTLEVGVELDNSRMVVAEDRLSDFYKFLNASFTEEWIDIGITGEAEALVECSLGTFELGPIPFDVTTRQRGLGGLVSVPPVLDKLDVVDSTEKSLTIKATLVLWNPSSISANLGDMSFLWSYNGYLVGMAAVSDVHLVSGNNTIECIGMLDPSIDCARKKDPLCNPEFAQNASREFMSKYISGDDSITIDVLGYDGSTKIPLLQPMMSSFAISTYLPVIAQDFLISSTMHLFSSSLVLELQNPLDTIITVLYLNATASYKDEQLGHILVDYEHDTLKPIVIPANDHQDENSGYVKTPKLPVAFDLSSVGYEALKKALGGSIEMDVVCHIKAKVGDMMMWVDFVKDGVETKVRKGF